MFVKKCIVILAFFANFEGKKPHMEAAHKQKKILKT
jgi:hypothetical protein